MRRHLREFALAGFGVVFIVAFVLVRASSFHKVDFLLTNGPGGVRKNHWPLTDPAKVTGSEEQIMTAFRFTRDEVERRVQSLLTLLREGGGV